MELVIKKLQLERNYGFASTAMFELEKDTVKSGKFNTGANLFIGTEFDPIWPFVHTIGKKKYRKQKPNEKIYLDGKEISLKELKNMTHYVTYYDDRFPHNILKTTVKKHIKRALRKSKTNYSYDEIIRMFQLKETFLNRRIMALSHNRWIYSFAIGFAGGKKIFCFRWLREGELTVQPYRFNIMEKVAKKEGLIMLIPVENEKAFLAAESEFIYKVMELK